MPPHCDGRTSGWVAIAIAGATGGRRQSSAGVELTEIHDDIEAIRVCRIGCVCDPCRRDRSGRNRQQKSTEAEFFNRAPNQEDRDVEILKEGLARLGYLEGSDLVIEARFAEGNPNPRLPALLRNSSA